MIAFIAALTLTSFAADVPPVQHLDLKTEIQWAVCETDATLVTKKIGGSWKHAKERITYFETETPSYLKNGLSFRVKEDKGDATSVVKIRMPATTPPPKDAECERDRHGSDEVLTCELKSKRDHHDDDLWTPKQKSFVEAAAGPVRWEDLVAFGPYPVQRWKDNGKAVGEKLTLESLEPDDTDPILELSLRVDAGASATTAARVTKWLRARGVHLCAKQIGKSERLFKAIGL